MSRGPISHRERRITQGVEIAIKGSSAKCVQRTNVRDF
jgi:hypothetical protein